MTKLKKETRQQLYVCFKKKTWRNARQQRAHTLTRRHDSSTVLLHCPITIFLIDCSYYGSVETLSEGCIGVKGKINSSQKTSNYESFVPCIFIGSGITHRINVSYIPVKCIHKISLSSSRTNRVQPYHGLRKMSQHWASGYRL